MFSKRLILTLLVLSFISTSRAQVLYKEKSATKASIYSALLPGAGQVYNGKYWKVPVLYAGIGTALYIANWNKQEYLHYRNAYKFRTDNNESTIDEYVDIYTESNLVTIKNYHQKNRDLAYIITAGIYLFNIIDAPVDAHLFNFNVNDDLALNIQPNILRFQNENQYTLSLTLNLR
jgi:hypothetical protein